VDFGLGRYGIASPPGITSGQGENGSGNNTTINQFVNAIIHITNENSNFDTQMKGCGKGGLLGH